MTDLDARRRRIEATLQEFADQQEDGVRPDFATRGVPLALRWLDGLAEADRPLVQAVLSKWLRTGTVDQLRLAARLARQVQPLASSVASGWARAELPSEAREQLGFVLSGLVLAGQLPWDVAWRPLVQRDGGHAGLGAALVGDRSWALGHLGAILGDSDRVVMQRLLAAVVGLNRAETLATWDDLARHGEGLSDAARKVCGDMVAWVRNQSEPAEGDGRLRWQTSTGSEG